MKNVNRYDCGNGEGMFDDKTGYWVAYEDYKLLLDKYEELALNIDSVMICRCCQSKNTYKCKVTDVVVCKDCGYQD